MKYHCEYALVLGMLLTLQATGCAGTKSDTTPPESPVSVLASAGDRSVTLTWTMVITNDLAGYYAYHREVSGGAAIRSDLITHTSVTIRGLGNGTPYIFYVTSIDEAGNESAPSPEVTATPNNEVTLTASGWEAWEAGDYTSAATSFLTALSFDPDYSDAFTGLGWTRLRQGELASAASRFDAAIARNPVNQDPWVGGLVVYRELPNGLNLAIIRGRTALENDPDYVFSHDPSIDADVVRLMLAQVYFMSGELNFIYAQELMDVLIQENGLDPGDPATWRVNGTTYNNYAASLLALIQFAFTLYGGL